MGAEATVERTSPIERLRASKDEHVAEQTALGEPMGREWARDVATYEELMRLVYEAEVERTGQVSPELFRSRDGHGGATEFVELIRRDQSDVIEFWRPWVGDEVLDMPPDAFVRAFAKGALDAFREIKDAL